MGREDQTRHVLATNRLAQALSLVKRSTPADLSLIFILQKRKERYSSPDGFGVLTFPGGGEGELSTAAQSPALLGELLLLILLLWETLRQLLRMAQPEVLGRVNVEEDAPCLTTLLEGHLCVNLEDGKE